MTSTAAPARRLRFTRYADPSTGSYDYGTPWHLADNGVAMASVRPNDDGTWKLTYWADRRNCIPTLVEIHPTDLEALRSCPR